MIHVTDAATYSTAGAMAYELTYSDGWIRKESKNKAGEWATVGKPYVVKHSKARDAERIKASVKEFLSH